MQTKLTDFIPMQQEFVRLRERAEAAEARAKKLEALVAAKDEAMKWMYDSCFCAPDTLRAKVAAKERVIEAARAWKTGGHNDGIALLDCIEKLDAIEMEK